ncbi:MAG: oligosaccharide flippase family protein [Verrucomicrobiota bacterium]
MSRRKRFTRSLVSGYLLLGATVLYQFASVPLALHYLSDQAILGLWNVAMQISLYLQLFDLGMSGSISRILVDHKDRPGDGQYGAVIKTGGLVLAVQGLIILVVGGVLSIWVPDLYKVQPSLRHDCQWLVAGQCIAMGLLFIGRMPRFILEAHQRYDANCYVAVAMLVINLGVMWMGFHQGWGIFSMLWGYIASQVFGNVASWLLALGLKLYPPAGAWGKANRATFREMFSFGKEMFLMSVGLQLINASQGVVIARTLGFDLIWVWSVATKTFMTGQQFVARIFDFSSSALAEMIVRNERERLLARFRDLVTVSASVTVWAALSVALCNQDFMLFWLKNKVPSEWHNSNNALMGLWLVVYATARCGVAFVCVTKKIGGMKYVYLFEGLAFVGLSFALAPFLGMNGIILSAIVTDLCCSGFYSFWRAARFLGIERMATVLTWFRWPVQYLAALGVLCFVMWRAGLSWNPAMRLVIDIATMLLPGLLLFWLLGLSPHLKREVTALVAGKLRRISAAT